MARVLVVYWGQPAFRRETFTSHLRAYTRFSTHDCLYLDVSRLRVPRYLMRTSPDLVIFQNTFMMALSSSEYARVLDLIAFVRDSTAVKAVIASDEQLQSDRRSRFIEDFGVSHVFTFASPEARASIYAGLPPGSVSFHPALSGYIDDGLVRRIRRMQRRAQTRSIDVGCRVATWPLLGRIGQMKARVADSFSELAPQAGFTTDISRDVKDTLYGADWLRFLLDCRYTVGCETGSSLLDRDGSISERIYVYLSGHDGQPTFEDIEAACFPGLDGQIDYRALAPRHLEAVIAKTCQVLVEGEYSGVLRPGEHYIEVKSDFRNICEVLELMKDEELRAGIVERAYRDIVESGRYSYQVYADLVFDESFDHRVPQDGGGRLTARLQVGWNRLDDSRFLDGMRRKGRESAAKWQSVVRAAALGLRRLGEWIRSSWSRMIAAVVRLWFDSALARAWWSLRALFTKAGRRAMIVTARDRTRVAADHVWFDTGIGDAWWRFRHGRRPPRAVVRDAAVRIVGEERLWRLTGTVRNLVRRLRHQEVVDIGEYVPTDAEQARREKKAKDVRHG